MKNYDPSRVVLTWKGIIVSGYAEGTMITAERNTDTFSQLVGAQGDVVDVRSRDKTGIVTFRLQAASPTNDLLSAQLALDELGGFNFGSMQIKEIGGSTLVRAESARLRRPANVEFAQEHSPREWILQCASLHMLVGGLFA